MEPIAYSIIAATCHGNRGAQAMLETVVGRLSDNRPGLRFHVFSYYPRQDRRLVQDGRVRIHSSTPLALVAWLLPWALVFGALRRLLGGRVLRVAPAAVRALGESTALVDLAGVSFIDGREKFLPFNVLTILPAWLLGVRVVKMPQAVGPFERRLNRLVAKAALPMCSMVWARGARTHSHLTQAGFAGVRFSQADDIAFNHQERWSLTNEDGPRLQEVLRGVRALRGQQRLRGTVGLCPSSVVAAKSRREGRVYEQVLAGLIQDLHAMDFAVVLFPNATRQDSGDAERNNDLPLMRRIRDACVQDGMEPPPIMVDFDINAAGIKQVIAMMDLVLVSRFHAMVGALSLAVPAAVLGWSHKYAEVMARFGLQEFVMDYQTLEAAELRAAVEGLFDQRMSVRARIEERLPDIKASAERPVNALLSPSLGADLA